MSQRRKFINLLVLCALLLAACAPNVQPLAPAATATLPGSLPNLADGWAAQDVRLLDPVDAQRPEDDLIAVYTRRSAEELQVRLDFLDLQADTSQDLYLALSNGDKGSRDLPIQAKSDTGWDTLIVIPASGQPYAQAPDGQRQAGFPISRTVDPDQDAVYLKVSGLDAARFQSLQVFVTPGGSTQPADHSEAFRLDTPSLQLVKLLIAFWDTLPARTPAQALRRWDGAHTGPLGQRHGLYRLLEGSSAAGVPVALLDLKTPASLSALDILGQVGYIRDLQAKGLVVLPDAAYGDPQAAQQSLQFSREAGQSFGFGGSTLAFGPLLADKLPQEYQAAFTTQPVYLRVTPASGVRLIPLPALYPSAENQLPPWWDKQVGMAGLSLNAKRALLDGALAQDPSRLVVLGGSLPDSAWGDSSVAPQAFAYLAGHPWIQALDEQDLLSMPVSTLGYTQAPGCIDLLCTPPVLPVVPFGTDGKPVSSGVTQTELRQKLRDQLAKLPPGPLARQAWETYLQLTAPSVDPYRQALQANYLGEVGQLVRLAQWAADPKPVSDCSTDLDFDGVPDCLLANEHFAATFETDGARLLSAAVVGSQGAVQVIGPYSQSGVGWGDPSDWQIKAGPASDPNEVPGAFVDAGEPFQAFQAKAQEGQITFTSQDGALVKIFTLTADGIKAQYQGKLPQSIRIPLVLNPASRFEPDWYKNYIAVGTGNSITWQRATVGPWLAIQVEGATQSLKSLSTFLDNSVNSIRTPEDPDRAYPTGHYLPFPFALDEQQPQNHTEFSVQLNVQAR